MIKICKYCAEEIKEAALVCKHCGKDQHIALVLFGAIKLLCGYGFYKRKSWARIYGLVLCGFGLINIPFGTLIAIYGIWVLIKSETAQLFIN